MDLEDTGMGEQRLFFSLLFTAIQQQQIQRYQQQALVWCGSGQPVAIDNLHLTLFFLGQVNSEQTQQLYQHAKQITRPTFTLTLDYMAQFVKPHIVYLAPSGVPVELTLLQHRIAMLCNEQGFNDIHPIYQPHVSLLRHVTTPDTGKLAITPLSLKISGFGLFRSVQQDGRLRYLPIWQS